ncbi:MAG: PQQ-binding-like beta-propeller repeat protein [Thermoguttaceae bacterium]
MHRLGLGRLGDGRGANPRNSAGYYSETASQETRSCPAGGRAGRGRLRRRIAGSRGAADRRDRPGLARRKGGRAGRPRLLWTSDTSPPQVSSPVGGDGRCYLLAGGDLVCIDTATGKEKWNLEVEGDFWASPVLAKDRVYAISRKGLLYVVSTAGRKLDEVQLDGSVEATPALVEGRIYIRTGNRLLCLGRP